MTRKELAKEKRKAGHADNFLLKMSGTKLGLPDYDYDKDYSKEEPKASVEVIGIILIAGLFIIGIGIVAAVLFA